MIDVQEFLSNNKQSCVYGIVEYNGIKEATYFVNYGYEGEDWFLESPCQIMRYKIDDMDINEFIKMYAEEIYGVVNEEDRLKTIEYLKSMTVGNTMYEIENFQYVPYLPIEVDNIEIMTEQEILRWMLEREEK